MSLRGGGGILHARGRVDFIRMYEAGDCIIFLSHQQKSNNK